MLIEEGSAVKLVIFCALVFTLLRQEPSCVANLSKLLTFLSFSSTGFSAAVICVGIAVVFAILVAAVFGVSVMKKWTLHSPGRVKIYRTRPGITIKIFPATPKEPRREVSLNNEIVTAPSSLVPIKA